MLLYFLKMMSQKSNQICVQLLQTLSILFENIRNETSLCELGRLITNDQYLCLFTVSNRRKR